jgi:hypothetical protein
MVMHGDSYKKLYKRWWGMKRRCYDKNYKGYITHGGRGITICEKWNNDYLSFREWSLNNRYKEELTLDRKDNDGNYEPNNCRWVNLTEQNRNRRNVVTITFRGKTLPLIVWCEMLGFNYNTDRHFLHKHSKVDLVNKWLKITSEKESLKNDIANLLK